MTIESDYNLHHVVAANLAEAVKWRRLLHQCPQPSWLEFFSSGFVAEKLSEWGYEVQMGRDILEEEKLLLLPDKAKLEEEYQRAVKMGVKEKYLALTRGGFTGVVATLKGGKEGATVGFRFDIDSNEITESNVADHLPVREGFNSRNAGYAHMCGHDAHTAVGLLLAKCFADNKDDLSGTVKLIFQANEENLCGAAAMVGKGVVDDLDYLLGGHVGSVLGEVGRIAFNVHGFMAMSRFEVTFTGRPAHAAGRPQEGKNALQAACAAISNLYAIARHSSGDTRINVGYMQAGTTWNVIPDKAYFRLETRGRSNETNEYMVKRACEIIQGAAKMYDLQCEIRPAAMCFGGQNSPELVRLAEAVAKKLPSVKEVVADCKIGASDDFTVFMDRVQKRGGRAMYVLFGTPVHGGHHTATFDIDEKVIGNAAEFLLALHQELSATKGGCSCV